MHDFIPLLATLLSLKTINLVLDRLERYLRGVFSLMSLGPLLFLLQCC